MTAPGVPGDALIVTARVAIPRRELELRASRSGGPGGQHVNTSNTRIELRWHPGSSQAFSEVQRARVLVALAGRLDSEGWLRLTASEYRSQAQNREAAETRLAALVRGALVVPKVRRATKPTAASRRERVETKRRRSETKQQRRRTTDD